MRGVRLPAELPLVHIEETADDGAALGFYAIVLGDRTARFIEYGEMHGFSLPLSAFWRMVAGLEEAGYREGRRVDPPPKPPRRRGTGRTRQVIREWVEGTNGEGFRGRQCAEALAIPQATVTYHLVRLVREGVLTSSTGRGGGYRRVA